MNRNNVLTVTALNKYLKALVQRDDVLSSVFVQGEISNFKAHSSGHWYFSLKDAGGAVKAVMFRSNNAKVRFLPQNGMKVLVSGRIDVYERDGVYQLYAEEMLLAGAGELYVAYEQLKEKLAAEGLFNQDKKRTLPKFAQNIGIVTSPTGAAVQDMLSILKRRNPAVNIYHVPAIVQGSEGADSICNSLDILYHMPLDIIIVGRGGGSIEDLWCFNEEKVVRKVAQSPIPIISAVGHETDYTLCDFAADVRAATPSMAAELAVPVLADIREDIAQKAALLNIRYKQLLRTKIGQAEKIAAAQFFKHPTRLLENYQLRIDRLREKLDEEANSALKEKTYILSAAAAKLDALSPLKVLSRGYSVCQKDGQAVFSASEVQTGDEVKVLLCQGTISCTVQQTDSEG